MVLSSARIPAASTTTSPRVGTRVRSVPPPSCLPGDFPARPTGWPFRDPYDYLPGKVIDDAVPGGLWRVDDKIYDISNFVHPGGQEFITLTKGTDVTELFHTHHLDFEKANKTLRTYEVDLASVSTLKALGQRNSCLTFEPEGFYCTLRRKIWERFGAEEGAGGKRKKKREEEEKKGGVAAGGRGRAASSRRLPVVGLGAPLLTNLFSDSLVVLHLSLLYLASSSLSFSTSIKFVVALGMLNGLFIGVGHNFLHQKDSLRRHYMDLCGYSSADFRMHHLFSHHPYTNTILDAELNQWLPEISFFPVGYAGAASSSWPKSSLRSFLLFTVVLPLGIPKLQLHRFVKIATMTYRAGRRDWIAQLAPVLQIVALSHAGVGGGSSGGGGINSLSSGIGLWLLMLTTSSAFFLWPNYLLGPHFNDECWHQGDVLDDTDWGLLQVQTNVERKDLSQLDRLIDNLNNIPTFNMHHIHHLFPTIDATELSKVAPIFDKHCEEWAVNFEMMSYPELARGLWRCLGKGYVPNERPRNGMRSSTSAGGGGKETTTTSTTTTPAKTTTTTTKRKGAKAAN